MLRGGDRCDSGRRDEIRRTVRTAAATTTTRPRAGARGSDRCAREQLRRRAARRLERRVYLGRQLALIVLLHDAVELVELAHELGAARHGDVDAGPLDEREQLVRHHAQLEQRLVHRTDRAAALLQPERVAARRWRKVRQALAHDAQHVDRRVVDRHVERDDAIHVRHRDAQRHRELVVVVDRGARAQRARQLLRRLREQHVAQRVRVRRRRRRRVPIEIVVVVVVVAIDRTAAAAAARRCRCCCRRRRRGSRRCRCRCCRCCEFRIERFPAAR